MVVACCQKSLATPSRGSPRKAAMRRSEVGRIEVLCGDKGQRRYMHKSGHDWYLVYSTERKCMECYDVIDTHNWEVKQWWPGI